MIISNKTRVLIVFCHPSPESFNPVMDGDELRNYLETGRNRLGLRTTSRTFFGAMP